MKQDVVFSQVHAAKPVHHRHEDALQRRVGVRLHQAPQQARPQRRVQPGPEVEGPPEGGVRVVVEPEPERQVAKHFDLS